MKPYQVVFAGQTEAGEKIFVYKRRGQHIEYHIQRPDGEFWALGPDSVITFWADVYQDRFHAQIESPVWSGKATGTKRDLIEAEDR